MNLIEGLNIEYIHADNDGFEAKMNLTPFHDQTFGYLHGGATIAFGETVAGYASNQITADGQIALGQTITANHMKPKKIEGYILAKGKLMHKGKAFHVWSIDMLDENDIHISHLTVTNVLVSINKD
ncbi:MAG: PaaI family thioesterase [Ruminiclostridium sp.]|nr:PaaI family thioesterase [Ruminiclostridium sp.]